MLPVWLSILFKVEDLVVYGPPVVGRGGHPQCTSPLFLVLVFHSFHTGLIGIDGNYPFYITTKYW